MKRSAALPRQLEARVTEVARRLRKPRRVVLREAINEYAARHDQEAMTKAVDRLAQETDTRLDPALAAAAARILGRTDW
jgi:predicted transcriptional regulator